MNNTRLVRLLIDTRAGKVRHLDQGTLKLYGLTEDILHISNDELCERLIAEHQRYQQLLARTDHELEQLCTESTQQREMFMSDITYLQKRNATLERGCLRWQSFFLGWRICSLILLLLTLLGPELDGFVAGWVLSMSSLVIAPKLKSIWRFTRALGRVGHRFMYP